VGLAVLDVLRDEGLPAHSARVGTHLLAQLRALAADLPSIILDVRGLGLFLGVELVDDRPEACTALVRTLRRDWRVLVSLDGPLDNVVKIKPPLVFSMEDAGVLVEALRAALPVCFGSAEASTGTAPVL
jgi:4-aminobutyrate aminotransferase-like enzyme